MNLAVETWGSGDDRGIALKGELDLATTATVERELRRMESESPKRITIDLRGLGFIDSTGLRVIVQADERARGDGRRLSLIAGPEAVHRVFEITLLHDRLDFVEAPEGEAP